MRVREADAAHTLDMVASENLKEVSACVCVADGG